MRYEFEYRPTIDEIRRGMRLACKPVYSGYWSWVLFFYSLYRGLCAALIALAVCYLIFTRNQSLLVLAPVYILICTIVFRLEHVLFRQPAKAFVHSKYLVGFQLRIDERGLQSENGRSQMFIDWRDIEKIVEKGDLFAAAYGAQGWVLSDRMLRQAGKPAEIRKKMKHWHAQALAQ